jgi:hypothetical protein
MTASPVWVMEMMTASRSEKERGHLSCCRVELGRHQFWRQGPQAAGSPASSPNCVLSATDDILGLRAIVNGGAEIRSEAICGSGMRAGEDHRDGRRRILSPVAQTTEAPRTTDRRRRWWSRERRCGDGADDGGTANDWGDTDDGSTVELGWEGRRGRGEARARPRSATRPTSDGSCVPDRRPGSRDCGADDRMSACGARGGRAGRRGRPIREERGIPTWRRRAEGVADGLLPRGRRSCGGERKADPRERMKKANRAEG